MPLSPDVSLMLSPSATYRRMAEQPDQPSGIRVALRRPAFVAVLLGAVVAACATGRVTAPLLLSLTLCWSFATAMQLVAAIVIVMAAPARLAGVTRAIDLLFLAHGPWSIWLFALAAGAAAATERAGGWNVQAIALLAVPVPIVWTAVIVFAFCRTILGSAPRAALTLTLLHQTMIWLPPAAYLSTAVQIWPRVLGALGR